MSPMEIEKVQKWLANYLKFQPKKELAEKCDDLVEMVGGLREILAPLDAGGANPRSGPTGRTAPPEAQKSLGEVFLKVMELANDAGVDLVEVLREHFSLGV
ncbi:MAG: hypothetical protein Kow0069_17010 [Promethearchaeota archaeon]